MKESSTFAKGQLHSLLMGGAFSVINPVDIDLEEGLDGTVHPLLTLRARTEEVGIRVTYLRDESEKDLMSNIIYISLHELFDFLYMKDVYCENMELAGVFKVVVKKESVAFLMNNKDYKGLLLRWKMLDMNVVEATLDYIWKNEQYLDQAPALAFNIYKNNPTRKIMPYTELCYEDNYNEIIGIPYQLTDGTIVNYELMPEAFLYFPLPDSVMDKRLLIFTTKMNSMRMHWKECSEAETLEKMLHNIVIFGGIVTRKWTTTMQDMKLPSLICIRAAFYDQAEYREGKKTKQLIFKNIYAPCLVNIIDQGKVANSFRNGRTGNEFVVDDSTYAPNLVKAEYYDIGVEYGPYSKKAKLGARIPKLPVAQPMRTRTNSII